MCWTVEPGRKHPMGNVHTVRWFWFDIAFPQKLHWELIILFQISPQWIHPSFLRPTDFSKIQVWSCHQWISSGTKLPSGESLPHGLWACGHDLSKPVTQGMPLAYTHATHPHALMAAAWQRQSYTWIASAANSHLFVLHPGTRLLTSRPFPALLFCVSCMVISWLCFFLLLKFALSSVLASSDCHLLPGCWLTDLLCPLLWGTLRILDHVAPCLTGTPGTRMSSVLTQPDTFLTFQSSFTGVLLCSTILGK